MPKFQTSRISDTDWGASAEDIKSISGYYFIFGVGCFSWCSKKQEIVAQSTAEAKFIAPITAISQASFVVWGWR